MIRNSYICRLAFLLFIAFPALLSAQTLQGKVVHIADGDTLTVLVDHQQVKVRLAEIDARVSPGLWAARVAGARKSGIQLDVNAEMVRTGYAWVYRQYAKDKSLYVLEDEARAARRGLWASDVRVPPWEWRKEKRSPLK